MATGLVLIMFGAFLAFAVEDHVDNVNLGVTGWILIFGGLVSIAYSRYTSASEKTVTRSEESSDPDQPAKVVKEIFRERRTD
jgi:hypothetical protein